MKKPPLAVSLIVAVNALLLNGLKLPAPAGMVDLVLITEKGIRECGATAGLAGDHPQVSTRGGPALAWHPILDRDPGPAADHASPSQPGP